MKIVSKTNHIFLESGMYLLKSGNPCESEGEFRLRGGQTQAEGLVEVCYEGSFRTIHLFSTRIFDAALVCRTLGFIGGIMCMLVDPPVMISVGPCQQVEYGLMPGGSI